MSSDLHGLDDAPSPAQQDTATPRQDTATDLDRTPTVAVPDLTRQDDDTARAPTGPGRVITLHRPLEGPRPLDELSGPKDNEAGPDTATGRDATPPQDTTPDEKHDTEEDTHTSHRILSTNLAKITEALTAANGHRPKLEIAAPRKALADTIGAMPTRYRWPLYHLSAAAAGEALALAPYFDIGLVRYSTEGAREVAALGWPATWSWWGTALAAAGLYAWSRNKHWLIAWPCTIPIASAVIGALLYTPNA